MTRAETRAAERIESDEGARAALQRRVLAVVVAGQVLGGAGLAAGITVGALLAQEMLGSDDLAGVPTALFTLGSALAAFLIGGITQRHGRRLGIGIGFAAGGLGAVGVVVAAVVGSVALLFVSLFVYGAGTATNLQARYAGTDLALPARRGTAISVALVATTVGAVAGPNLVVPLGRFATRWTCRRCPARSCWPRRRTWPREPCCSRSLRPDPFLVARQLDARVAVRAGTDAADRAVPALGAGVVVGATVMVLTQIAMVAIMTMTPVHMRAHGHGLGEVGLVIGIHVGAMYLPSLLTGVLVDRIGRVPMAVAAGVTLLVAGVTAAWAPGDSLTLLIVALTLLGLGWNLGLIAGTALLIDGTVSENRAKVQGAVDVLIALGGAGGGALSGVVVAGAGFPVLALGGGLLAMLLVPALFRLRTVPGRG